MTKTNFTPEEFRVNCLATSVFSGEQEIVKIDKVLAERIADIANARLAEIKKEWVKQERPIFCAYCGETIGVADSKDICKHDCDISVAHAEQCKMHPLFQLRKLQQEIKDAPTVYGRALSCKPRGYENGEGYFTFADFKMLGDTHAARLICIEEIGGEK